MELRIVELRQFIELSDEIKKSLRQKLVENLRDEGELSKRLMDAFTKELSNLGYPTGSIVFSFGLERRTSEGVAFYGQVTELQALRNRLLPNSGRSLSNRFLNDVTMFINHVPNARLKSTMAVKLQPSGAVSDIQETALRALQEAVMADLKVVSDRLTTIGRKVIEQAGSAESIDRKLAEEGQLFFIDGTPYLDIYEHGVITQQSIT